MATEAGSDEKAIGAMVVGRFPADPPRSESDWDRLSELSIDERLGPLLYWKLRGDRRLPERCRVRLRSELYRAEASTMTLYRGLSSLVERASARGLSPPILLKGGVLATTLYEEVGLRPMSDLDVLVPRAELDGWLGAARDAGFHRTQPEMAMGLTERVHYQIALVRDGEPGTIIEIHFGLVAGRSDWRSPDPTWFLERSEPWEPPPGTSCLPVRRLLPGPHLLYLAAHALLQHGGAQARLIWVHDIHLLVEREGRRIEWKALASQARSLRWGEALSAALARAREIFGTTLSADARVALESLSRSGDRGAAVRLQRLSDPSMSRAELVWSELRSVPFRDRLRWARAILLPGAPYMRWRYKAAGAFWPALYPYRWARVAWEGTRALLQGGVAFERARAGDDEPGRKTRLV